MIDKKLKKDKAESTNIQEFFVIMKLETE